MLKVLEEREARESLESLGYNIKDSWGSYFPTLSVRSLGSLERSPLLETLEDVVILCKRPRIIDYPGLGKRKLADVLDFIKSHPETDWRSSDPWYSKMNWVSDRFHNCFLELGVETIEDVYLLVTHPFMTLRGHISLRSLSELRLHLDRLISGAPSPQASPQESPLPVLSTPDELADFILSQYEGRSLVVLESRIIGPDTLKKCGSKLGLTRERVRQLEGDLLSEMRSKYSTTAQEVSKPLLYALGESGYFLPVDLLPEYECRDIRVAIFALTLCGLERYRFWGGKYLTNLDASEIRALKGRLRSGLKSTGYFKMDSGEVSSISCKVGGVCLESEHLEDLLGDLGVAYSDGGSFRIKQSWSSAVDQVLKQSGIAMTCDELRDELSRRGEDHVPDRAIEVACQNNRRIYPLRSTYKGSYIYDIHLPCGLGRLNRFVTRCLPHVVGETHPVSVNWLISELAPSFDVHPITLKFALGLRDGIQSLGSSHLVACEKSCLDYRTLPDRVIEILSSCDRPLSRGEISSRLPEKLCYVKATLVGVLFGGPPISNISAKYVLTSDLGFGGHEEEVGEWFRSYFEETSHRLVSISELESWYHTGEFSWESHKGLSLSDSLLSLLKRHYRTHTFEDRSLVHPDYLSFRGLILGILREEGPKTTGQILASLHRDLPGIPFRKVQAQINNLLSTKSSTRVTVEGKTDGKE